MDDFTDFGSFDHHDHGFDSHHIDPLIDDGIFGDDADLFFTSDTGRYTSGRPTGGASPGAKGATPGAKAPPPEKPALPKEEPLNKKALVTLCVVAAAVVIGAAAYRHYQRRNQQEASATPSR